MVFLDSSHIEEIKLFARPPRYRPRLSEHKNNKPVGGRVHHFRQEAQVRLQWMHFAHSRQQQSVERVQRVLYCIAQEDRVSLAIGAHMVEIITRKFRKTQIEEQMWRMRRQLTNRRQGGGKHCIIAFDLSSTALVHASLNMPLPTLSSPPPNEGSTKSSQAGRFAKTIRAKT